jgi:hypothetical protein
MMCPHGGAVTRGPFATGQPSVHHGWVVLGCHHKDHLGSDSPCVTVRWFPNGPSLIIDRDTVGSCLNALGVAQGQVVIV